MSRPTVVAVILDIGGVLELNPRTGWQTRWALRLGVEPEVFATRLARLWSGGSTGAVSLADLEAATAAAFALDRAALAALMADSWAEYLGTLDPEMVALVRTLRRSHRVALLSNSFVGARERERAAYGLEELCELIVYSHEVGMMKPDPAIYRLACERLGVSPAEAVHVDDREDNVEGARAAGLHAILHRDVAGTRAALRALGVG